MSWMHLNAFIAILVAVVLFFISIDVLRIRAPRLLHILFVTGVSLAAFWSVAQCFLIIETGETGRWFWHRAGMVGWLLAPPFLIHALAIWSRTGRKSGLPGAAVTALSYGISLIFLAKGLTGDFVAKGFTSSPAGTLVYRNSESVWLYAFVVYQLAIFGVMAWLLMGKTSNRTRLMEKRQSSIILVSFLAANILMLAFTVILPFTTGLPIPPVGHLVYLVPAAGWLVAMHRYQVFQLSPAAASEVIISHIADAVFLLDSERRVLELNERASSLLDASPESLRGKFLEAYLRFEAGNLDGYLNIALGGPTLERMECELLKGEEAIPVHLSVSAVTDRYREASGYVLICHDIRHLKQLEILARKDALTELPNRRSVLEALERETNRSSRYGHPLSVLLIDVDHFKKINDTLGHPTGDRVLVEMAAQLRNSLREQDICGRFGGEEFLIVLPDLTLDAAAFVAEKLRKVIEALRLEADGTVIRVTASFGVASLASAFATKLDDPISLIARADRALYAAKAGGRNQVVTELSIAEADGGPMEIISYPKSSRAV